LNAMKLLALVLLTVTVATAQDNFWNTLAEVGFQSKKDANGFEVEVPLFSKHLKTFQGKKIRIKGYIIPLAEVGSQSKFMLSALPFNLCYFCGAAGPETVMEVMSAEKIKFSTKAIVMEGTLMLNDKDPDHHIYILKAVKIIN
jgi:hypothetical protein